MADYKIDVSTFTPEQQALVARAGGLAAPGNTVSTVGAPSSPTAPPAPTPTPTGENPAGTPSPYYPRYTDANTQAASDYLSTFKAPEDEATIAARKRQEAQAQIDALNKQYDTIRAEQQTINEGRNRSTASVNTLTGLSGSSEANVAVNKTNQLNQRDVERIEAERGAAISNVLAKVKSDAAEEARNQRLDARADAQSILDRREKLQAQATQNLTTLAQSGVTAEGLRATDPASYQHLVDSVGDEALVKAMFTLNRPAETILDKRVENGKYIVAYQNPLDGGVRVETLDLGIPSGYSKTVDAGDKILVMPDNWDGDPSKLITINKGLTPAQQKDAAGNNSGDPSVPGSPANQRMTEALQLAQQLRNDSTPGKHTAVGASLGKLVPFGQALGLQGDRSAFEAKLSTLKSNLTLDNLKLLKGAMSDKDLAFLNSVGSSLDPNMSEAQFNAELDRIIGKLQTATGTARSSAGNLITAPDGTQVELID